MDYILSEPEIRVLGSLVEKEITTPEYYPMSLNALTNACNQKSNREPVVAYEEAEVFDVLLNLKEKGLAIVCEGIRVLKFDNYFADKFELSPAEVAVMCVMMLRGPQTAGELRARTERLHAFESLAEVESTLNGLASRETPLVMKLPRQPGRKENRYAHLLAGEVAIDTQASEEPEMPGETLRDRVERLETEMQALLQEHQELRRQFAEFRKQFE